MTALIIEAEPLVVAVLRAILQNAGWRVLAAENADAGLQYYNNRRLGIDLVVVDRLLPGSSARPM